MLLEERAGAVLLLEGGMVLPEERAGATVLPEERAVLLEERAGAVLLLEETTVLLEETTVVLLEDGVVTTAQLVILHVGLRLPDTSQYKSCTYPAILPQDKIRESPIMGNDTALNQQHIARCTWHS